MTGFAHWRKSSYSAQEECVEVGNRGPGIIGVRDTKGPVSGIVVFTAETWSDFLTGVRSGRFDLP
ncbi:DUF397 domain-containing protein [Parasphingorhabdus pacifica]